jgi:hypothetical protein
MKIGQRRKRCIKWKRNPYKCRIIQKRRGLEYALVSKDMEQATDFSRNPYHLANAVWGCVNNRKINYDGFKYNPKIHPDIHLNKTAILITNPEDEDFALRIPGVLDFLHQIEDDLSMPKSVARNCHEPPRNYNDVWYIEGNKQWINMPVMLSFYTLCISMGMVHEPGALFRETIEAIKGRKIKPYHAEDVATWEQSRGIIEKLLYFVPNDVIDINIENNYPSWIDLHKINLSLAGFSECVRKFTYEYDGKLPGYWPIIQFSG